MTAKFVRAPCSMSVTLGSGLGTADGAAIFNTVTVLLEFSSAKGIAYNVQINWLL